jgi:hypothetical protein
VGCGNSTWGVAIAEQSEGRFAVVNSDFDAPICDRMRALYPRHQWDGDVDACALAQYPDGAFGCVLDKATFDALVVSGAGCPPQEAAQKMAAAAYRVLQKPQQQQQVAASLSTVKDASSGTADTETAASSGGVWLIVSNHPPSRMLPFVAPAQHPRGMKTREGTASGRPGANTTINASSPAMSPPTALRELRCATFAFRWRNVFDEAQTDAPYIYEFETMDL